MFYRISPDPERAHRGVKIELLEMWPRRFWFSCAGEQIGRALCRRVVVPASRGFAQERRVRFAGCSSAIRISRLRAPSKVIDTIQ